MYSTAYPFERIILLLLAGLRAELTVWVPIVLVGLLLLYLNRVLRYPTVIVIVGVVLISLLAPLTALISADVIEHYLRLFILGYDYNPYVSAIGEWEGWMGPTRTSDLPTWEAQKCQRPPAETPWWGDVTSFCRNRTK